MLALDVKDQAIEILGTNEDDVVLARITEAIERLSIEGQWDALVGYCDICAGPDRCLTLPSSIETPLAVNIGGRPARFRNKWFEFHLNGPGSGTCGARCDWTWDDRGDVVTVQDLINPSQIVAYFDRPEDANAELRVYADDINDQPIRTYTPARRFGNKALTATFVQPSYMTPITISVNFSDSFVKNNEVIIFNPTTANDNYYRIQATPTPGTVTILQSSTDNDAAGTAFPLNSTLKIREWTEGFLLPMIPGYAMSDPEVPLVKRITRFYKQPTVGPVTIIGRDSGRPGGTLLAIMNPNEQETRYRRIQLSSGCEWVRMRYRRKQVKLMSWHDEILTNSRIAVMNALRSLDLFRDSNFVAAQTVLDEAVAILNKTDNTRNAEGPIILQVNGMVSLTDSGNMM